LPLLLLPRKTANASAAAAKKSLAEEEDEEEDRVDGREDCGRVDTAGPSSLLFAMMTAACVGDSASERASE
jgi:hypothetical protein